MMAFIIILFGKGGLDYFLCMRPDKVMIEMSGINPSSDSIVCEHGVNNKRSAGIYIDINF